MVESTQPEEKEVKGMRPIWHFVGIALAVIGGLILLAGIYYLFYPSHSNSVLRELHPNIWWGAIMIIAGVIFIWKNKGITVE